MGTTNSSWFTTTKEESYEVPYKSINAPITIPFSVTLGDGAIDAVADVVNLVKLPQSAKILFMYFELPDHDDGGQSAMYFNIVEISGGTTTTTALSTGATLGQTAVAGEYIFPVAGSSFLHEGIPTDDGTAKIVLAQTAAVNTDKATSVKGFVVYI